MPSTRALVRSFVLSAAVLAGCSSSGSGSSPVDPRALFLGTWVYQAGSTMTLACPGQPASSVDLSRIAAGRPATFTMTLGGGGDVVDEVDSAGCEHAFHVQSDVGTAIPGDLCSTFPDGRGGLTTISTKSGTKSTSDGRTMTINIEASVGPTSCDAHVSGTAAKVGGADPDAG
jgi:hypothetical protein